MFDRSEIQQQVVDLLVYSGFDEGNDVEDNISGTVICHLIRKLSPTREIAAAVDADGLINGKPSKMFLASVLRAEATEVVDVLLDDD